MENEIYKSAGVECDFVANLRSSRIYIQFALNLVMLDATGKCSWNFPSIMIQKTGVFKIEVTDFSCKAHRMPKA